MLNTLPLTYRAKTVIYSAIFRLKYLGGSENSFEDKYQFVRRQFNQNVLSINLQRWRHDNPIFIQLWAAPQCKVNMVLHFLTCQLTQIKHKCLRLLWSIFLNLRKELKVDSVIQGNWSGAKSGAMSSTVSAASGKSRDNHKGRCTVCAHNS